MLRKAWYAVAQSHEVTARPMKVRIHGEELVLYRTTSQILQAVNSRCPHRGCDLSLGSVIGEELQCPYHGWRFDLAGQCAHIPANRPKVPISTKLRVGTYPVCEMAGLVWIYTSAMSRDQPVPTVAKFPELNDPEWCGSPFIVQWKAHISRVVESVLDVSHLPFVHPEQTGEDVDPIVDGPEYSVLNDRIVIHPLPFVSIHPMEPRPYDVDTTEPTEIELIFPNQWIIRTPMGEGTYMCTYLTFTPVDDETTRIFGIAMRNFGPENEFLDSFHVDHTLFVMKQDQDIIESLIPRQAPFDLKQEFHVPSDGPTLRYRVLLKNAVERERSPKDES